jgi:hypothetical protein
MMVHRSFPRWSDGNDLCRTLFSVGNRFAALCLVHVRQSASRRQTFRQLCRTESRALGQQQRHCDSRGWGIGIPVRKCISTETVISANSADSCGLETALRGSLPDYCDSRLTISPTIRWTVTSNTFERPLMMRPTIRNHESLSQDLVSNLLRCVPADRTLHAA